MNCCTVTYGDDPVHLVDGQLKVYAPFTCRWAVVEAADQGQIADQTAVFASLGRLHSGDDARATKLVLVVYRALKGLSLREGWIGEVKFESPCVATLASDPVDVAGG
jgi:hypothetical protein